MKKKGLYIHIPFCVKKCKYCDFVSHTPRYGEIDRYIEALGNEMKVYNLKSENIETIFIGGGTPTILNEEQLNRLFEIILENININNVEEYSIEANPGTLTSSKLSIIKKGGVNRLSIGLQAIQKEHLEFMGRIHTLGDFEESYFMARESGFNNINVDLIFAYENLKVEEWKETINYIVEKNPEHISAYSLIIEEGTQFYNLYREGKLNNVEDNIFIEMYRDTVERLLDNNYNQYEISNFSKKGYECKHNIKYWKGEEYFGIGTGASGYIEGIRYTNVDNVDKYMKITDSNKKPIFFKEKLSEIDVYNEKIMLGLRMNKGIEYSIIDNINSQQSKNIIEKTIDKYLKKGYIEIVERENKKIIKLTQHGREISNTIILELML